MTTEDIVNFTINGKAVSVPKGTTVYKAATQLGLDIPIFCYHDRMPPFGACRVCLVQVEKMPKLQTSCTLVATEGMVVNTQSQTAVDGRKGILEFLLINHPLDCPICDRGGECPLQEQALRFGPGESRFFEDKRHFIKPLPLGSVLMLDRERCIVCARCTRFGDEIAGDHALEFNERGYKTEVNTPGGGPVDSKFIGNTIMICPVGALTSQVYRFRARPWDNDSTNSTCTLCPVGCSMILDSRDGEIMRTRTQENPDVNDIWMCDKGWFGYEFTSNPERIQKPLIKKNGKLEEATWEEALALIANKMTAAKSSGKIAGIGGNPLTVEENYLFQKLMRDVLGVPHVDHRVGMPIFDIDHEALMPGMEISIGECEKLSHALLFGLDLTEEFPVIWLRLRKAINKGAKVLFAGHFSPEISKYFSQVTLHAPGEEIAKIKEMASYIESLGGEKCALFIGKQYLSTPQRPQILKELLKLQQQYPNITLNILEGRNNSVGATVAGMRPDLGPLGQSPAKIGLNVLQVLEESAKSGWDVLYVAGANVAKRVPSKLWSDARANLDFLVVQDLFLTKTARQADVVLPTLSYIEKGGSFINIEGRVQTLLPGKEIPADIFSDGDIFMKIATQLKQPLSFDLTFLDMLKPGRLPLHRPSEVKEESHASLKKDENQLFASFAYYLFDNGVRMKHNPHVSLLAKEPGIRINASEATKRDLKDQDLVKLIVGKNAITAKIKIDHTVADHTAVLPLWFEQYPVRELAQNLLNGLAIQIDRL